MPKGEERATRLRSVLHVLDLIFNEGYLASGGPDWPELSSRESDPPRQDHARGYGR
jgi:predicted RNA polymerase sigma factor